MPGLVIEQHESKETIILRSPKKTRLPRKARRWTEDIKEWLQISPTEAGREAQKREVFRRRVREATSTQTCQDEVLVVVVIVIVLVAVVGGVVVVVQVVVVVVAVVVEVVVV
ncbi:hypothetical protein ElyMa_002517900 [Elysia marginata]|uniref:Uncharacterized protein n=1 Tax=Elysia marginata TaxID=1093978 RepID=A0AAV4GV84_9GAST|nr:hypothetical protein ElyMa_002517900 [Elysia marginata]